MKKSMFGEKGRAWSVRVAALAAVFALILTAPGCGSLELMSRLLEEQQRSEAVSREERYREQGAEKAKETEDSLGDISREEIGNYAYGCLDETGRRVYDQMLYAIENYEDQVKLDTTDTEVMKKSFEALCCDYGNLFWIDSYTYTSYTIGDKLVSIDFSPNYTMDQTAKEELQIQIDEEADQWLAGISVGAPDYQKARYVFETLIEKVDYVESSRENQNIISVFLYHETVCQGYAGAVQYLLRRLGIPSIIVTGYADGEAHAWNLIRLDRDWYHMDATWGNSTYLDVKKQEAKYVNYDYLCMTDQENALTHRCSMSIPLPECNSMEDNYYVQEGLYFESFVPEEMGELFRDRWLAGDHSVTIKCGDAQVYHQVKEYFIEQQMIADYCAGMEYVYYMEIPQLHVISINFS